MKSQKKQPTYKELNQMVCNALYTVQIYDEALNMALSKIIENNKDDPKSIDEYKKEIMQNALIAHNNVYVVTGIH